MQEINMLTQGNVLNKAWLFRLLAQPVTTVTNSIDAVAEPLPCIMKLYYIIYQVLRRSFEDVAGKVISQVARCRSVNETQIITNCNVPALAEIR